MSDRERASAHDGRARTQYQTASERGETRVVEMTTRAQRSDARQRIKDGLLHIEPMTTDESISDDGDEEDDWLNIQ